MPRRKAPWTLWDAVLFTAAVIDVIALLLIISAALDFSEGMSFASHPVRWRRPGQPATAAT